MADTHKSETPSHTSFLLKKEHVENLLHTRFKKSKDAPDLAPETTFHHVSEHYMLEGILFQNDVKWTLWVNSEAYSPQKNMLKEGLTIQAKDHETAEINDHGQSHLIFPGQSYQTQGQKVERLDVAKDEEKRKIASS